MKKLNKVKSVILSGTTSSIKGLEKYIGTIGYCTDHLDESIPLKIYTLEDIALGTSLPFAGSDGCYYKYFIPKDTAVFEEEPEEKKYRPYDTLDDLPFNVGDVITLARLPVNEPYHKIIVTEITYNELDEVLSITLGSGITYEPNELLEVFAIFLDNQWVPMGVEE